MANVLTGNPLVIDTAAATALSIGGQTGVPINIGHFEFEGYSTGAADSVVVKDAGGNVVWEAIGRAIKDNIISGTPIGTVYGLIVSTLSSGKLLIYFRD